MEAVTSFLRNLLSTAPLLRRRLPKNRFDFSRFADGDRVNINGRKPRFAKLLQHGAKFDFPDGFILHDDIIGASPNQCFKTSTGKPHGVKFPDLDTYISSMPRKVTPIYHNYASCIISLFDIHVAPPTYETSKEPPLEILDTGTGHGSVTLSLARAIQAANLPLPAADWGSVGSQKGNASERSSETSSADNEAHFAQVWQEWRNARRAVIHSVEISPTYSRHAERKVVSGFRRGLYLPHIDFHIANIHDWIDRQLESRRNKPFLSYVVLDIPDCHRYLTKVISAMKEDALIAIFAPSVSQIGNCIQSIRANDLPLKMEKVVEVGEGISTGRQWDVKLVTKRTGILANEAVEDSVEASEVRDEKMQGADESLETDPQASRELEQGDHKLQPHVGGAMPHEEPVMVCRPKVGLRVVGGGFIGLWRRAAPS